MKTTGFSLLAAALLLSACSFDRTLDTLVPGNAYGVVLVDHPQLAAQLLGQTGDLPWAALDGGKPWAAAALPGSPPGIFVALALADKPSAWTDVEAWSKSKTGLEPVRSGSYAVLTSTPVTDASRFDLARVRTGDLVAVYVDVRNVFAASDQLPFLKAGPAQLILQNLAGVRLGFGAKDGGVVLKLITDLRPESPVRSMLQGMGKPSGLASWTGLFPTGNGIRLAASVPPELLRAAGSLWSDPQWAARWAALSPLLGPGLAVSAAPRSDGAWAWSVAVETVDPQAVRQALKTTIAGGDLQKNFAAWSLDADTPLIYQDKADGAGVQTQVTLGNQVIQLVWGEDRVAAAGGAGAAEALRVWQKPAAAPVSWFGQVPSGASLAAEGSMDGLGARAAVRALSDGNLELSVWTDAAGLRALEARAPQALQGLLLGSAGLTP